MKKILISSCLLGENVKYNGGNNHIADPLISRWISEDRLVPFCPEVAGGLPVPREPVEIQGGEGKDVLQGNARAVNCSGEDYSAYFIKGAHEMLALAKHHGITIAILKERSPSCGTSQIYAGGFNTQRKSGMGITARLLQTNGIAVFSETQLSTVLRVLEGN